MPTPPSRAILVTGAASGIGKAVAAALLADGHRVAVLDRDASALAAARPALESKGEACFIDADVTSEADCERAVATCVDAFGALHGVMNNAGLGMGSLRPDAEVNHPGILELTPEAYMRFFDVNVLGAVRLIRAALPQLRAAGFGRIVNNTTSYLTMHRVQPYGAVKAAFESLSAVWAKELEDEGITVNVVVPGGPTDTPFVNDIGLPRERMLRPAVMAPPVQWLMSDDADGFTGRRLVAGHWDTRLAPAVAAARIARPIGWPELTGDAIWGTDD